MKNIFLLSICIILFSNTLSSQTIHSFFKELIKYTTYKDLIYTTYDAKGNIIKTVEISGDLIQVKDMSTTPTDLFFYDKNTFFQYNNTSNR